MAVKGSFAELVNVIVLVCTLVGEIDDDSGTAESAAVFLFGFFFNSCDVQSVEDSRSKLHAYFGPLSRRMIGDICSAVQYIHSCLSAISIEKISRALDPGASIDPSLNEEFGRNIKVSLDYGSTVNDDDLDWLESDDDNDTMSAHGFTMNYSGDSQCVSLAKIQDLETETANVKPQKASGRAWLYEEVASYFSSDSGEPETCVDDLVTTVFDILCSSRSNEQLQTEVSCYV